MSVDHCIENLNTREIPLAEGKVALVDAEDHKYLKLFRWKTVSNGNKFYAWGYIPALGKDVPMHRVILDAPKGLLVDHRNGDGLDNRKRNIRLCTHSQNMLNRPGHGKTSRYKGVSWDKQSKSWVARIRKDGKYLLLGRFEEPEQAAEVYNQAAREIHGEFAWINQPFAEATPTTPRKRGRKPKPWYRSQTDAWYTQINKKKIWLAKGIANEQIAHQQLAKVLSALGHATDTLPVPVPTD